MFTWHIETRKIKDLKPHSKNPRRLSEHDAAHLQKSLEKFGLIDKPIITKDGMIIGGHQRVAILKKMKAKEVECYVPDKELEQKDIDELNIRLNRNTGEWDFELLANQWEAPDLIEWGFKEDEIPNLEDLSNADPDDDVLEPGNDEDAITKPGDRFDLGSNVLICGDSTDPEIVKRCLSGEEPILMVTDPPYGVEYDPEFRNSKAGISGKKTGHRVGKIQNDDKANWALAWSIFPGSIAYVWHAAKFASEVQKSLEDAEFKIVSQIIWSKQHFALSRGDYHWQHEPCWYAVKKDHNHNWQGARDQTTLWKIDSFQAIGSSNKEEKTAHSTQKPLECMARPIRNNTAKGESVYDPFLGSGTTLIAAEQLDRICYGIEISPAYCDIIVKRWIAYRKKCGKDAKVIKNGQETKEFE